MFAACAGAIAVLMVGTWLVSLPLKNVSIVDIVWGAGFVLVAWVAYAGRRRDREPTRCCWP